MGLSPTSSTQVALPWNSFLHNRHNRPHYRGTQSYITATTRRSTVGLSPTTSTQVALPWESVLHNRHNKPHYRGTQSCVIDTTGRITVGLSPTLSPQQAALTWDSFLHHRHKRSHYRGTLSYIIATTGRISVGLCPTSRYNRPHYQAIPHVTAERRTHTYSVGRKKVKQFSCFNLHNKRPILINRPMFEIQPPEQTIPNYLSSFFVQSLNRTTPPHSNSK